jgi:peptidoglycan/xylan/chitin deacetylase (PgdA/CDA1 family)
MHEFHLKMVKIVLVITALALLFGLLGGISLLKNNYYMRTKYLSLQFDYLKEKIAFGYSSYGSSLKWIESWRGAPNLKPARLVATQSIPILLYHGVITAPGWKSDGTNISLNDFQDQMFALKKAGYQSITLAQFLDFMQAGKTLPQKSILLTFDDGRADSFYPVDPILRVLNFNAVMFVITGRSFGADNSKNTFHLSEDELKKMLGSGRWEMASHTQNGHGSMNIDSSGTQGHFLTNKLWLDEEKRLETEEEYTRRINTDLIASKQDLEKNLGIKVLGFAYPFGDYGNDVQNFPGAKPILNSSASSLFPLAFRQASGNEFPNNYPGSDFRLVKRIDVNENMSKDQLLSELNSGQEKSLPYADSFSGDNGWITAWGSSELKSGLLLTRSSVTENSSMTFLNGTFQWTNYTMSAGARLLNGNSFAAVARYANGNNYVSCDFTGWGIALSQNIGGVETVISESDENIRISPDQNLDIGIGVSGNTAACYIGNKKTAAGNISPSLNHGGIGFKTWDNSVNNSSLLVSNLKVDPTP